MTPAFILQALGVEVSPEWINYLEEPITMKTETHLAFEKELDTLLDQLAQNEPAMDASDLRGKISVAVTGLMQVGYNQGVASQQALVDATVAEGNGMQTSIIRATVAAVMEAFAPDHGVNLEAGSFNLIMNLEAQRTIWDRVELTTKRDASQENVIFTIHKK